MITRSGARTALAELKQQQQQQVQSTTFVKQIQEPDGFPRACPRKPSSAAPELQQVEALAKKMDVISIDSSSEDHQAPGESKRDAIDLSESSKSVMEISSSEDDEDDSGDSFSSEDEDGESPCSGDENHGERKSSTSYSTPASKLLAGEVAKLIRGGDMKKLKVDDCRTYLRNYGLRVAGTKPVLIDRIKQHIELKEGGSGSYAKSTFTKDCTGDVCKGDVVLFQQKVYDKFCVTTKSATQAGRRTVAGRVVKESYGAQRQQHTFTVEVLWSTGCRPLAPMKQLLVKGRNLYKQRTRRQEWADEEERERSLAEKHDRGAAARQVRAIKRGRFKGSAERRIGLEGPARKQLTNPYTNTLASKENCNSSSGTRVFQSAVPVDQFAAVSTQQYEVHPHTSMVSEGAITLALRKIRQFGQVPGNGAIDRAAGGGASPEIKSTSANAVSLGKIRQFGQPFGNGEMDRAAGVGASTEMKSAGVSTIPLGKSRQFEQLSGNGETDRVAGRGASSDVNPTGANAIPLGKIRQFGQPYEDSEIKIASGGATTIMNKHRQWFKRTLPSDQETHTQQGCKSRNVLSSSQLPGGSSGLQAGPCDSGHSVSMRAPISTSTLSKGACSTGVGTRNYDGKISASLNRPSSQYDNTSKISSRPSSPYHNISSSLRNDRPSSPYFIKPCSPYHSRPSSPYHGRPPSPLGNRPSSPFPIPHNNRPAFVYDGRPSSTFPNRPSYPISNRPASPYQNRPASPSPSRMSSFNSSRPRSPSPYVWEGELRASPSSVVLSRQASPSLKIPSIVDGGLLGSAPSSHSLDTLACPSLNRQPSPNLSVGQNASKGSEPNNRARLMEDSDSTKWRATQRWPTVSHDKVPKTGFPCPTASCTYRGSRQCSSGVCYHCCIKKGGACRNPRHRREFYQTVRYFCDNKVLR